MPVFPIVTPSNLKNLDRMPHFCATGSMNRAVLPWLVNALWEPVFVEMRSDDSSNEQPYNSMDCVTVCPESESVSIGGSLSVELVNSGVFNPGHVSTFVCLC